MRMKCACKSNAHVKPFLLSGNQIQPLGRANCQYSLREARCHSRERQRHAAFGVSAGLRDSIVEIGPETSVPNAGHSADQHTVSHLIAVETRRADKLAKLLSEITSNRFAF